MKHKIGSKNIDLSLLVEAIRDQRIWIALAVVHQINGKHYEIVESDNKRLEVHIEVFVAETGEEMTVYLGGMGMSGSSGIWQIPPVGTEVIIAIPKGDYNFSPVLIAVCPSTNSDGIGVPEELDETTLVVSNEKSTIIRSSSGDITIKTNGGKITVDSSDDLTIKAGGDVNLTASGTVKINGDDYHLPKWDDFMLALQSFFIVPLKQVVGPTTASLVGSTATTFDGYFSSTNSWFSNKGKNG